MSKKIPQISIDLRYGSDVEGILPSHVLSSITIGCQETLARLGKLGNMIEVFRITFTSFEDDPVPGPVFKIYFHDPLGNNSAHTVDYRSMGLGGPTPSAEDIAEHLCGKEWCHLPALMNQFLKRGTEKLERAQKDFNTLISS